MYCGTWNGNGNGRHKAAESQERKTQAKAIEQGKR